MSRSISFQRGLSDIRKFVRDNVEFFKLKVAPPRNNFLFTDYSPKLFRRIRELWGINKTDYIESFKSTTLPSFSEGRSGAFLYFSSDYKYIVKTTILSEFNKLLSILPDYVQYLSSELERGHKSLITRFYGAHRIVMYDIPIYFVVMENICPKVDEKYDLKGSWVNRHGSTLNKNLRPKTKLKGKTPLFLDNDLHNSIALRPDVAIKLAKQLVRDVTFLSGYHLLLVTQSLLLF